MDYGLQVDNVKRFRILWGDLNLNIFKNDLLYQDSIYTYNNTLNVKNSILSTKYKKQYFSLLFRIKKSLIYTYFSCNQYEGNYDWRWVYMGLYGCGGMY